MKSRVRIRVKKRFYIGIVLVATLVFGAQYFRAEKRIAEQSRTLASLDAQIAEAESYNASLQSKIDAADDPETIEQKARDQLGWVMRDETLYVEDNGQ